MGLWTLAGTTKALATAAGLLTSAPPSADLSMAGPAPLPAPVEVVPSYSLGVPTVVDDPSGRALARFHEGLRRTERGEGRTRVLVYGASHVAGDFFTRVLRHRLQERFGDAGPGFVFPAKPWKDSNQRDVNLSYSNGWSSFWVSQSHNRDDGLYGLAGASFSSDSKRDWFRVATAAESPFGRSVSQVEVWYWKQPGGGDFVVTLDGKKKKRVSTRSKAAGPDYAVFEVPDGAHEIEVRPRGNGEVLFFGVALDRDRPGVVVDSLGINGARASTQLSWDPRLFAEHLSRRSPDLLVLAYGTNDAGDADDPIEDYERRYDLVVNRLRSLVPQASCLAIGPSDRPVKVEVPGGDGEPVPAFLPRPRQRQVIETQRKIAHRYGCGYWDMAGAMGGDLSMLSWVHSEPRLGSTDYVHLTKDGYERVADLFWTAIMAGRPAPPPATEAARSASP